MTKRPLFTILPAAVALIAAILLAVVVYLRIERRASSPSHESSQTSAIVLPEHPPHQLPPLIEGKREEELILWSESRELERDEDFGKFLGD